MKIVLTLIICSLSTGECMPPYQWPSHFGSSYDCLMFGYKESIKKMEEIGREEVNKYGVFIRFHCTPGTTI